MTKYGAKRTTVDNITFASKKEAEYYLYLKLLKQAGDITELILQPKYLLVDAYKHPLTGIKVLPVYYRADFYIAYADGRTEVIDVKGFKTPAYKLKKKMFESKYNIPIVEVY